MSIPMDLKIPGPSLKLRQGKYGGNRKPQTFRECSVCKKYFGPLDHLRRRFCSRECKYESQRTGKRVFRKTTKEARRAHRRLAYQIELGKMKRPDICEECGNSSKKIEAAHYDYSQPLKVRWLCRSCHVKWDHADSKGATYVEGNFAEQKATRVS